MTFEQEAMLARLRPTAEERERVEGAVRRLEEAVDAEAAGQGIEAKASVQGSLAKDTWLAGSTDLDLFLLMDPATPAEAMGERTRAIGEVVLQDARQRYAQHPYLLGTFEGLQVDLVPAYRIDDPSQPASAVDRTPFHTAWVNEHLDAGQKDQVRLLKRWMKGTGTYGAETAIGGFSGYLCEVLVAQFGSFDGVVAWLAGDAQPRRFTPGDDRLPADQPSPLLIADPVDPTRNVAAAVTETTLARGTEAAQAFQADPDEPFFFPPPAHAASPEALANGLQGQGWLGLLLTPQTDRLDLVLPQFQRAGRLVAEALERAGFGCARRHVAVLGDQDDPAGQQVALQWITPQARIPDTEVRKGPPAAVAANADRFRQKWDGHALALEPVQEVDGRLQVTVRVPADTPAAWLEAEAARVLVGKHVQKAWKASGQILGDPADAPADWAPVVADLVLDRRPWQQ